MEITKLVFLSGSKPPSRTPRLPTSFSSVRKRLPEQRSGLSALHASFHEGRGPSLKDGLRPEPRSIADHGPHSPRVGCLGAVRTMQGRGPRSLRSGLRPDPRQAGAVRRDTTGHLGVLPRSSVGSVRTQGEVLGLSAGTDAPKRAETRLVRRGLSGLPQTSGSAHVAASDSWPLEGVSAFDGSRLGPLSDRLEAHRRVHKGPLLGRSVARTVGLRTARHCGRVTQVL